jgi:capsular polysaccharide biosynthesis protein
MAIESKFPDDEIDLRELIHTLFRKKWLILGITLVAAVTAFVYSRYGLPTRYTAQAQVLITKPLYTTNLESRIQSIPQTPEASVLKDLALAQDLLWSVFTSPDVIAVLDKGMSFEQFTANMSAKLAGTSKLFLGVSGADPKISATIVNVWADKFATQINSLYSVNEKALTIIEKEAQNARQKWDAAEQTLMEKLPKGIVETRKIELENKQNTLVTYLNTLTQFGLLTSDAQSLKVRLDAWPASSPLGIEYQLSLIGLYLRATRWLDGIQIQLVEPTTEAARTVAEAKASLDALTASLDSQRVELQAKLEQLKQDITTATLALESANYQLTQLTTERNLALNAYQALSAQLEETRIDLARDDLAAKVASRALPTVQPIPNRTLMITMIAGVLAFALACFGALVINWWKVPAQNKPAS